MLRVVRVWQLSIRTVWKMSCLCLLEKMNYSCSPSPGAHKHTCSHSNLRIWGKVWMSKRRWWQGGERVNDVIRCCGEISSFKSQKCQHRFSRAEWTLSSKKMEREEEEGRNGNRRECVKVEVCVQRDTLQSSSTYAYVTQSCVVWMKRNVSFEA